MKAFIGFVFLLAPAISFADPGDTMTIRTHDRVHMSWNGNYDETVFFPTQGKEYQRVIMKYTLGCPDKGCSEWDYTANVYLRHPTGALDSTLKTAPNYLADGSTPDSFLYANDTVYHYFFNPSIPGLDSMSAAPVQLILFGDAGNPTLATDTQIVWNALVYRPEYDGSGNVLDSQLVHADGVLHRQDYQWYQVFEVIDNLELGRLITPYAADKTKTWEFTYTYDVTEFAMLLKDSVTIRAHYSGYQDGFTVSLDFEFLEGTPALKCTDIIPLWQGSFPYGATKSIEEYLVPRDVSIQKSANTRVKLRVIQTGHGFGGNENCAEFCAKEHYVKINGTKQITTLVWKDNCGSNAIYPQPGTWIYDRANWCPGEAVRNYDYWIDEWINDGSNTIDLDMEAFTNINNNNTSYIISGYLLVYESDPSAKPDVSLEAIVAPNSKNNYVRFNPTCGLPRVAVKNTGVQEVTSIRFVFGVDGGTDQNWTWTGSLAAQESREIDLAYFEWTGASSKKFHVRIDEVNGAADAVAGNNMRSSGFELTPVFPTEFQVWFKANSKGNETTLSVHDPYGNVIWSRDGFNPNESIKDTLQLGYGCYYFKVSDASRNGFKFWANSDGTGSLSLRQMSGQLIQVIDGDFGTDYIQYFTVTHPLNTSQPETEFKLSVYPNPAQGRVQLEVQSDQAGSVQLYDMQGRIMREETIEGTGQLLLDWNLSGMAPGVYLVEFRTGQGRVTRKLVVE